MSDLNRKAAELMGCPWPYVDYLSVFIKYNGEIEWLSEDWSVIEYGAWSPTTDPRHAALLEQDIERRGLQAEYTDQLCWQIDPKDTYKLLWEQYWLLATATPEQRTRAYLEAVKDE